MKKGVDPLPPCLLICMILLSIILLTGLIMVLYTQQVTVKTVNNVSDRRVVQNIKPQL